METVPVACAIVTLGLRKTKGLEKAGVRLGNRFEIDLNEANLKDVDKNRLRQYWAKAKKLWDQDERPSGRGVTLKTRLVAYKWRKGEENHELLEDLTSLAGWGEIIDEALETDVDWDALKISGARRGMVMNQTGNTTSLSFNASLGWWPETLGGAVGFFETEREITVKVNHAAWRDRKTRRLDSVEIRSVAVWPKA